MSRRIPQQAANTERLVPAIGVLILLAAAIQVGLDVLSADVPRANSIQAVLAVVGSLTIVTLIPRVATRGWRRALILLFVQRALSLVARDALPDLFLLENSVVMVTMIGAAFYLPLPHSSYVGVVLLGLPILFEVPIVSTGPLIGPMAPSESLMLLTYAIVTFGLALALRLQSDRERFWHDLAQSQKSDLAKLADANLRFQEYSQRVGEESTIVERNRITGDLHDTVGYTLTTASMFIGTSIELFRRGDPSATVAAERAREVVQRGYQEVRTALHALRSIEEQRTTGLPAIARLVGTFREVTGVDVDIHYTNVPPHLGREIDRALYHVVQESLVNAFRHGSATHVRIILSRSVDCIEFSIEDNGLGATTIEKGIGLTATEERIRRLGGEFEYASGAEGFRVRGAIPLSGPEETYEHNPTHHC